MSLQDHYPQSCPFCRIAAAYPPESSSPVPTNPDPEKVSPECFLIYSSEHVMAFLDILPISPGHILITTRDHYRTLGDMVDAADTTSSSSSNGLWQSRNSRSNARETSRALGEALPLISRALCRATGIEDWNVVQNNGERAAQVVPHVHFHLIPRYQEGRGNRVEGGKGNVDVGMLKSWRMFGRGTREELDEGEAAEMAGGLRREIGREVEGGRGRSKL